MDLLVLLESVLFGGDVDEFSCVVSGINGVCIVLLCELVMLVNSEGLN